MSLRVLEPCADGAQAPDPPVHEDGWSGLRSAVALWKLLDDDRASQLDALLSDEVEVRGPDGLRRLDTDRIRRLLALLDGIDEAVAATVTDADFHVRAEHVERVQDWGGPRVRTWSRDGELVHSIGDDVMAALGAAWFLQRALDAGCEVLVD